MTDFEVIHEGRPFTITSEQRHYAVMAALDAMLDVEPMPTQPSDIVKISVKAALDELERVKNEK